MSDSKVPDNNSGTPSAAHPTASIIPPTIPPLPYPSSTTKPFYWVKYSPKAASTFAIRGWVFAVFWLLMSVWVAVFIPPIIDNEPWFGYVAAALTLIGVWISVYHAVGARMKWGADDGLVFALSDRGISLPLVGEVPWSDVTQVRFFDMGIATGSIPISAFQSVLGIRNNAYITIYTRHTLGDVVAAPAAIRERMVPGAMGYGFITGHKAGVGDKLWYEAIGELAAAAKARNIPISNDARRKGKNSAEWQ